MYLYGVSYGTKFGITTSAKQAVKAAKANNGTVRRLNDDPDGGGWDFPTFWACSNAFYPRATPKGN